MTPERVAGYDQLIQFSPFGCVMLSPLCHFRLPTFAIAAMCAALWLIACPETVQASCGDYLRSHMPHSVVDHADSRSPDQTPVLPCRCHGIECQSHPWAPVPTEPPVLRHGDQTAWWMCTVDGGAASTVNRGRLSDERCDQLTLAAIEHVPIAARSYRTESAR